MKTYIYALIERNDKFLFLKRPSDKKTYPDYWNLPGGKLEEKESEIECIKREVLEETGLRFLPSEKILDIIDSNEVKKKVIVYKGKTDKSEVIISKEHSEYDWVSRKDFSDRKIMPYMKELF